MTFSFQCPYVTPMYPADWRKKIISAAVIYDLAPGTTVTVKSLFPKDNIPPLPTGITILHGCILAEVYNPIDHVPAGCNSLGDGQGKIYQRNSDVVNANAGNILNYQLVISNYHVQQERLVQLQVIRPVNWENVGVWFSHCNPLVIKGLWQNAGEIEAKIAQESIKKIEMGIEVHFLEPARIKMGAIKDEPGVALNLAKGSSIGVPMIETLESLRYATVCTGLSLREVELVTALEKAKLKLLPGHAVSFHYLMRPRENLILDVHFEYLQVPSLEISLSTKWFSAMTGVS